ncbi:Succinylglutamate desuccinylase / Aspartoacylase family protein [Collimonas sp. OK242]|jgi:predicted deacylase|uniref:M14 family metallopeptidase n=1 Tax=Collimonas sp. OK242 TaxID=1798195 RepID=UPI00089AC83A|nr:M14 family metallopeptidase [Collimonas sp. OK242]SDY88516.1 Succinylglutamate desuccinylase / Aspartoacylase family protein [Collimonas sp. OK242]
MSNVFPEYPIEIAFPDLLPYSAGNTGIPYVYSFSSQGDGPHVMINALTHGNEVCGAIVVKALLDLGLKPRRGKLTLSFANVEGYQRFDPLRPDASRFIDQDLNRVWTREVLDDRERDSSELRRARAMLPVIDTVDLLLDIHSMHERSAPLIVSGPLPKGIALARQLNIPQHVISDAGHPEGRRMRDYGAFGDNASARNALLIECGQHWEAASVRVAKHSTARFLLLAGVIERSDLPHDWWPEQSAASIVIKVTQPVVASSMNFRFAGAYTGLETFAEQGTVIGWDSGQPITTPYPDCVLVMPSLRQLRPGVTVLRFGRILD